MLPSEDELSQLIDDAMGDSSVQQQHAFDRLILLAKDPQLSDAHRMSILHHTCVWFPYRDVRQLIRMTWSDESVYYEFPRRDRHNRYMVRTRLRQLWEIIVAHPSIPVDTLRYMAYCASRGVCANPALPDLLAAQPKWIQSLTGEALGEYGNATIMCLLRCGNAPRLLVEPIARGEVLKSKLILEEAQRHVALVGDSDETAWIQEVDTYWRSSISTATPLKKQEFQEYAIAGILPAWAYGEREEEQVLFQETRRRYLRAIDPAISPEECADLAQRDESVVVRLAATINPTTPEIERHKVSTKGLGQGINHRYLPDLMPLLRQHTRRETANAITIACGTVLQQFWRSYSHRGDNWSNILHTKSSDPFPLLEDFLWVMRHPQLVESPRDSQDAGEYWVVLLAWALGIQPDITGNWGVQEKAGLEALSKDGHRWVRAARARLSDPRVTFGWW